MKKTCNVLLLVFAILIAFTLGILVSYMVLKYKADLAETPDNESISSNSNLDNYDIKINSNYYYDFDGENSYIMNKTTGEKYIVFPFVDNKDDGSDILFGIYSKSGEGIYNLTQNYILEPNLQYTDVSCYFHTDVTLHRCTDTKYTLLSGKYVLNVQTGNIIIEADKVNYLGSNKFLATVGEKDILYNEKGEILLKADKIFSAGDGLRFLNSYVTIDDGKVNILKGADFKAISGETIIKSFYKSFHLSNSDYSMFSTDIYGLVDKVDLTNNKYFKYNDNDFSDEKIVLMGLACDNTTESRSLASLKYVYVIDNNGIKKLENYTPDVKEEYCP